MILDTLPMADTPPSFPFTGFVFNINSRAQAHLDPGDHSICVVVPIGDFVHGELVLDELGLVIALQSGEAIAFRSNCVTHYNLDFEGRRVSLALQTDRGLTQGPARLDQARKLNRVHSLDQVVNQLVER